MIRATNVSELNFATQNPSFEIATQRVGVQSFKLNGAKCHLSDKEPDSK